MLHTHTHVGSVHDDKTNESDSDNWRDGEVVTGNVTFLYRTPTPFPAAADDVNLTTGCPTNVLHIRMW